MNAVFALMLIVMVGVIAWFGINQGSGSGTLLMWNIAGSTASKKSCQDWCDKDVCQSLCRSSFNKDCKGEYIGGPPQCKCKLKAKVQTWTGELTDVIVLNVDSKGVCL